MKRHPPTYYFPSIPPWPTQPPSVFCSQSSVCPHLSFTTLLSRYCYFLSLHRWGDYFMRIFRNLPKISRQQNEFPSLSYFRAPSLPFVPPHLGISWRPSNFNCSYPAPHPPTKLGPSLGFFLGLNISKDTAKYPPVHWQDVGSPLTPLPLSWFISSCHQTLLMWFLSLSWICNILPISTATSTCVSILVTFQISLNNHSHQSMTLCSFKSSDFYGSENEVNYC
jgi:hypothetical protein